MLLYDCMSNYYNQILKSPLLSKDEEKELFKQAAAGDITMQNKIINSNIRFVISIAKSYKNCGCSLEDLIEAGIEGLIIAVKKFDYTRDVKFITYAVWWIREAIQKFLYETGRVVHIPVHRSDLFYDSKYSSVSLDAPVNSGTNGLACIDFLDDEASSNFEERICDETLMASIKEEIKSLPKMERIVISERFGFTGEGEKSYRQLAKELNCSHETIRTYEKKALVKLKQSVA